MKLNDFSWVYGRWRRIVYGQNPYKLLLLLGLSVLILNYLPEHFDQQIQFGLGHRKMRGKAQGIDPAVNHADAVFASPLLNGTGTIALQTRRKCAGKQQARALHGGDDIGAEFGLQRTQLIQRLLSAQAMILSTKFERG